MYENPWQHNSNTQKRPTSTIKIRPNYTAKKAVRSQEIQRTYNWTQERWHRFIMCTHELYITHMISHILLSGYCAAQGYFAIDLQLSLFPLLWQREKPRSLQVECRTSKHKISQSQLLMNLFSPHKVKHYKHSSIVTKKRPVLKTVGLAPHSWKLHLLPKYYYIKLHCKGWS